MSAMEQRRRRCAVYTRKSTEEGLEQEYNSIDAQRDAGHAYITSRRVEGWIPVATDYDDAAYSGGNLDRPALKQLLADIEARQIDIVVVYKIDRLTRSLHDFSKLVEVFDRHGVTFISVTQHFNTTDAMGRMTLNMMLTFAQFEREVTAERIRDKLVASKRKGFWMHGVPALGYGIKDRRLVLIPEEAQQVRDIFRTFVELGSMLRVAQVLRKRGARTKSWTTLTGRIIEGVPVDKSSVHKVLHNRTYLAELKHRDQWFQGTHEPIIDRPLWDAAHAILVTNSRVRGNATRANVDFLLKGLVVGLDGRALSPWHTTKKNGRRYRYYLSTRLMHEGAGATDLPRLPAAELEAAVVGQLRRVLRAPDMIAAVVQQAVDLDRRLDEPKVTVAMLQLDQIWEQLFPTEQQRIVRLLIEQVIVAPTRLEIRMRSTGIEALANEFCTTQRLAV